MYKIWYLLYNGGIDCCVPRHDFFYIVFASIYYVTCFQEVKKANRNLVELKKKVVEKNS